MRKFINLPIIIIPGTGGSKAYSYNMKTNKTNLIWLNFKYMLFPSYFSEQFKLYYNPKTKKIQDSKGFIITFPGWGNTDSVENLNDWKSSKTAYFQELINTLLENPFYVKNKTLRAAPYDFRRSPLGNKNFMLDFAALVEETFRVAKNRKVIIVAHSLGSLIGLHFLKEMDKIWKKIYLHAFIATSAPLGGSVKALQIEISGSSFGMPRKSLLYRDVERSFSSTAYMLPRPIVFPQTQILVESKNRNYTADDYFILFRDINFTRGYLMFHETLSYFDVNKALQGIDNIYCIHGAEMPTAERLKYGTGFPDIEPETIYGAGDGTVNLNSLQMCQFWENVNYITIKNVNHNKILSNSLYISHIKRISKLFI